MLGRGVMSSNPSRDYFHARDITFFSLNNLLLMTHMLRFILSYRWGGGGGGGGGTRH